MPIEWAICPQDPLAWFGLRYQLLHVLFTHWLLYSFLWSLVAGLLVVLPRPLLWWSRGLIMISEVLLVNVIYSTLATECLSGWVAFKLIAPIERVEGE